MRRSTLAVMVVAALAATACAGSLHQYGAGLPAAGVVTRDSPPERATGPPTTPVTGAEIDPQPPAPTATAPGLPGGAAPGAGMRPSGPQGAAATRATAAGISANAAAAPVAAAPSPGHVTPAPGTRSDAPETAAAGVAPAPS